MQNKHIKVLNVKKFPPKRNKSLINPFDFKPETTYKSLKQFSIIERYATSVLFQPPTIPRIF